MRTGQPQQHRFASPPIQGQLSLTQGQWPHLLPNFSCLPPEVSLFHLPPKVCYLLPWSVAPHTTQSQVSTTHALHPTQGHLPHLAPRSVVSPHNQGQLSSTQGQLLYLPLKVACFTSPKLVALPDLPKASCLTSTQGQVHFHPRSVASHPGSGALSPPKVNCLASTQGQFHHFTPLVT